MGGINISHYPRVKNDYASFPSITNDLTTVPADSVDLDSFVRVKTSYTATATDAAVRGYLEGDSTPHLSPMDECVRQFFDGTISEAELQAEYERLLKKELFGSAQNPTAPLTEWQKETETEFYNTFRQKILTTAVERNNAEGKAFITGEMNAQRSWSYYNSKYYYASGAAVSAITAGAQHVSQTYGSSFQVPAYLEQGKTDLYNFNTALRGDPFLVSEHRYIIDPKTAPPKNFIWFYETGGDASSTTAKITSFTTTDKHGNRIVIDCTTDEFDPKDPTKAQTWVLYTDEAGVAHRLSTDLVFDHSKDDLRIVSDLLAFSRQDTEQAVLLNQFLSNLQLYPKRYFDRFPVSPRSINVLA